jgi:hypothetical protein
VVVVGEAVEDVVVDDEVGGEDVPVLPGSPVLGLDASEKVGSMVGEPGVGEAGDPALTRRPCSWPSSPDRTVSPAVTRVRAMTAPPAAILDRRLRNKPVNPNSCAQLQDAGWRRRLWLAPRAIA